MSNVTFFNFLLETLKKFFQVKHMQEIRIQFVSKILMCRDFKVSLVSEASILSILVIISPRLLWRLLCISCEPLSQYHIVETPKPLNPEGFYFYLFTQSFQRPLIWSTFLPLVCSKEKDLNLQKIFFHFSFLFLL